MPPSKAKPKKSPIRVQVGVPTYGNSPAICQLSFGSFIGNGVAQGFIHHLGEVDGAYIDRARNDIVRQALANDSTHLFFVDQDMIIPEGTLARLLAHKVPYVGGIYFGKDDWFTPVAFHVDPFYRVYEVDDLPMVRSKATLPDGIDSCVCGKPDDHLHKVGGCGLGCTLISMRLFKKVSSKETGEDIHFAMRCKEVGVDRLMDGFVQCGHVRNQIVTRQHYDWAKQSAPKCDVDGCGRAAFWDSADADAAESAKKCWRHMYDPDKEA